MFRQSHFPIQNRHQRKSFMSSNQSDFPDLDLNSLFRITLGVFEVLGKNEIQSELHGVTMMDVRCIKCNHHTLITEKYLYSLVPKRRKGCSQCEK